MVLPDFDESAREHNFLVATSLSVGEKTNTFGVYGRIVFGDDVNGVEIAHGDLNLRTVSSQEVVAGSVMWSGWLPIVGRPNTHLAGYVDNYSGNERKFNLSAYMVKQVGE